jgi:DNA modification methylase
LSATWSILPGDCRETLASLPAGSVQTCVTSPPYFGLRDYGHEGQIGLEPTPDEFVASLVDVFRSVRRVLRDDGTVWLNLGDSYAGGGGGNYGDGKNVVSQGGQQVTNVRNRPEWLSNAGVKPKDLLGVPWMVAFALRADGWYLGGDIIWSKANPMPESVTDRPTKAHEYLFLLSKSARYFYDADAIRDDNAESAIARRGLVLKPNDRDEAMVAESARANGGLHDHGRHAPRAESAYGVGGRNKRSVWTVATQPYPGAHFATFPPKLIEPCILAGSPEGGTVLDPFAGAGTTGMVALRHGRSFIGLELNEDYVRLARDRIIADSPLLNTHAEAA